MLFFFNLLLIIHLHQSHPKKYTFINIYISLKGSFAAFVYSIIQSKVIIIFPSNFIELYTIQTVIKNIVNCLGYI